jgi:ABC-type amino acid transport substrate-binding protein
MGSTVDALTRNAREVLAPTGRLRVGAFFGSPLSMTRDIGTGEVHGLCIDLGRELAKRLDVPFELVGHQRIAEVLAAMQGGEPSVPSDPDAGELRYLSRRRPRAPAADQRTRCRQIPVWFRNACPEGIHPRPRWRSSIKRWIAKL